MVREFANEISLFCRRMTDLGFNKENYSCIIMQDVYERLDRNTALRFRSKIELIKELGQDAVEDLDSLSSFIRSEATTLELSERSSSSENYVPRKLNAVQNPPDGTPEEIKNDDPPIVKCILGCETNHRLIDCSIYMNMETDKIREFIGSVYRCYYCLGTSHIARNCLRKKENVKCKLCSENNHHWSLCMKHSGTYNNNDQSERLPLFKLNALASSFKLTTEIETAENSRGGVNIATKTISATQRCHFESGTEKLVENAKDFSPLALIEVKDRNGSW